MGVKVHITSYRVWLIKKKIDHIWKSMNHTKKIFVRKMIVRSISILPANLATYEDNLCFCASFWTFCTPKTQNAIWSDFFSKSVASAYCASLTPTTVSTASLYLNRNLFWVTTNDFVVSYTLMQNARWSREKIHIDVVWKLTHFWIYIYTVNVVLQVLSLSKN